MNFPPALPRVSRRSLALFLVAFALAGLAPLAAPLRAAADLPALWKERVKSVVAVEFYTETELDRRPSIVFGLVVDNNGTIILQPGVINPRAQPSQLKDFRVHLPGRPSTEFGQAEYLGQDSLSNWHFIRVEEKLRSQLTAITAFAAGTPVEPAMAEDVWGIGLRDKDEDFQPYLLSSTVALVQSLPERTAVALSEVAGPGLPVFNRSGTFLGLAIAGFGSSYVEYSRTEQRGNPIMLMNVDESRVFTLAGDITPWFTRVPANVNGRPITSLGIYGVQPMDPEVAAFLKLDNQSGCVVSEILEGGPAEAAGLKPRDIIVALNGQPLPRLKPDRVAVDFLDREISRRLPGDKLTLTVLRGNDRVELTATLAEEPRLAREADRKYFEKLGFTVREFVFDDAVARHIKRAEQRGVIANFVKANSPVSAAGLRADDWILEVDGTAVATYAEAVAKLTAIEADSGRAEFVMLVSRNGETAVERVKLK